MASLPDPILQLIQALHQLPGIGPRSAERLALHLFQIPAAEVEKLAGLLVDSRKRIQTCPQCGGLTESIPCAICNDPRRSQKLICIVERPTDILTVEKSGTYRGVYHVLGGKISPLNGVEPEDLRIAELEARIAPAHAEEIIIALPTDVEGDATSFYLAKRLQEKGVKVTRIAHGLPSGTALEYADELTLSRALEGRREI